MKESQKIAVAMSGGVDSSVAAALMVEKYGKEQVIGLTLKLFCYGNAAKEKSCCSQDSIDDARAVCQKLGIAYYVINAEKEFEHEVVTNFITEYQAGRTPNPCIRCNKLIKFDFLLKKAEGYGVNKLATGHYARIRAVETGYRLLKGTDKNKDQSYFLYDLTQEQLQQILFPLGVLTKAEVRVIAEKYGLVTAQKIESQDICFIPGSVNEYLKSKIGQNPGQVVDCSGKVLGTHDGLAYYTIGQRKGLGGGFTAPMFVIGLNKKKNELIIGPEAGLFKKTLTLNQIRWINGLAPEWPFVCQAVVRYQAEAVEAQINHENGALIVSLNKPQRAITPGQSVVFYQGQNVIGGGLIMSD